MVDHNAQISAAAKAVLKPLGCMRKGRSRTWLDDHGWWVGVVEFQPSGTSSGSYLSVGASYLWKPAFAESSLSFDALIGPRPWHAAIAGESFIEKATELACVARDSLAALREHHGTVAIAAKWLSGHSGPRDPWANYHLGIAFGLSRRLATAAQHFRLAIDPSSEFEWVKSLGQECAMYARLVEDRPAFTAAVIARIRATRSALSLPEFDLRDL